jgi:uncharacterized protein YqeY
MADLKDAMRAGDVERREAIRMLRAALKNEEIERRRPLSADEAGTVVSRLAKRHAESIDQFRQGNRSDLVAREQAQLAALEPYLPRLMGREQIEREVRAVMAETPVGGPRAQGELMAALAPRLRGKADLKEVSGVVRELLAAAEGGRG